MFKVKQNSIIDKIGLACSESVQYSFGFLRGIEAKILSVLGLFATAARAFTAPCSLFLDFSFFPFFIFY